jgi:hypothetical protein
VLSCLTVNTKLSTLPFLVFISQGWVFFSCILRGVGLLSGFGIGICLFLFPPSVHATEGSCILTCSISLFDLQHFRRLVCVEWQDTAIAFIGGREKKGGAQRTKVIVCLS